LVGKHIRSACGSYVAISSSQKATRRPTAVAGLQIVETDLTSRRTCVLLPSFPVANSVVNVCLRRHSSAVLAMLNAPSPRVVRILTSDTGRPAGRPAVAAITIAIAACRRCRCRICRTWQRCTGTGRPTSLVQCRIPASIECQLQYSCCCCRCSAARMHLCTCLYVISRRE